VTPRGVVAGALGAAVAVILVIVVTSGGSVTHLRLLLTDADGLTQGSQVKVGGAVVGSVDKLTLYRNNVAADLALDPGDVKLGAGLRVQITTADLLGAEYVSLSPGDASRPLPAGATIPAAQITIPTDLDQVLNVLDPDTRTRLQILVNELGTAITNRRANFSSALYQLPPSATATNQLLSALVSDNHTLADLVQRSDSFVGAVASQRQALAQVVDVAGQTMRTVAGRDAQLRETLTRTPGTLVSLQRFLADLRTTTTPLGPAARDITATAPALTTTLEQLSPFANVARPALAEAVDVAPRLTDLGDRATPVLERANLPVKELAVDSNDAQPVTNTLNKSIEDLLGLVQGWARAIQDRDGIGHYFRGHLTLGSDTITALAGQIAPQLARAQARARKAGATNPDAPGSLGVLLKYLLKP
jgi:virulence factor Mce-like protein